MGKRLILAVAFLLAFAPVVSATLSESMEEVQLYASQYDSGELNLPQLIVYVEYVVNRMYESSDRQVRGAFSESEIKNVFEETEAKPWENYHSQFEKVIDTKDFNLVFTAHQYYRYDRDYWESRESDIESYYTIGYHISPKGFDTEEGNIASEIEKVISDLEYLSENEDTVRFEEAKDRMSRLQQKFWSIPNCEETMNEIGLDSYVEDDPYTREVVYYKTIEERMEKNCWDNSHCENVCETKTVCEDSGENCEEKVKCEDVEVCEDVFNEDLNETEEVCSTSEKCETEIVCEDSENCYDKTECYDECDESQECDEYLSGELKLEVRCVDEGSNIYVNAWGDGLDPLNHINDGSGWTCDEEVNELVELRKLLQKDLNDDFVIWFFEVFLTGEDYEKIINGENGFRQVLRFVIQNEEEISHRVNCMENKEWPAGFEKIDINYNKDNVNVEVWEKFVPIEWDNVDYYTTLYKYSWIPDEETSKGILNYQIDKLGDIGPTPREVAEIRNNPGQMEVINSLSERYGGSFDVSIELKDEEEIVLRKYLVVNPNVTVGFFDDSAGDEDIALEVEYDSLYRFIQFVVYEQEGKRIEGPSWVWVEDEGGPGEFFSVVGEVSKFWKEGVTIKPRYALIKLLFSSDDIISLINSESNEDPEGRSTGFSVRELQND